MRIAICPERPIMSQITGNAIIYPLKKVTGQQFPVQHLNCAHTAKCKRERLRKRVAQLGPFHFALGKYLAISRIRRETKYSLFLTLRRAREISARPLPPHHFSTHRSSLNVPTHHPIQEPLLQRRRINWDERRCVISGDWGVIGWMQVI